MGFSEDFASRDLAGKILLLDEIDSGNRADAIPELVELLTSPGLDNTLRGVTGDTLRALLGRNEAETLRGLSSTDPTVQKLCIQVAAAHRFRSAFGPLSVLAEAKSSPAALVEMLSALGDIDALGALPLFRRHARHEDPFVSALCVEALGTCHDADSVGLFRSIVEDGEGDERYQTCSVQTEKAIGALGALDDEKALEFLATKIHHRNPTARRFIHEEIVRFGPRAIPHLSKIFETGDVDERILAANLLGTIGDRRGADFLISALDQGKASHLNIRFAIYEALGLIPSLKSVVCLFDAMAEDDEMTLLAVATSLDRQLNPGIVGRILGALKSDPAMRGRFLRAVASGRAVNLFGCIFGDPALCAAAVEAVRASQDAETIDVFRRKLLDLGTEEAKAQAERLCVAGPGKAAGRLLAVDDSKSMLLFYRGVAAAAGMEVTTAGDGKQAMDLLDDGQTFDLIITDLNMPVMDGIEFTRRARGNLWAEQTPILMATTESEGSQKALAMAAGVTGFLQKPLKPDSLAESIRQHVKLS